MNFAGLGDGVGGRSLAGLAGRWELPDPLDGNRLSEVNTEKYGLSTTEERDLQRSTESHLKVRCRFPVAVRAIRSRPVMHLGHSNCKETSQQTAPNQGGHRAYLEAGDVGSELISRNSHYEEVERM